MGSPVSVVGSSGSSLPVNSRTSSEPAMLSHPLPTVCRETSTRLTLSTTSHFQLVPEKRGRLACEEGYSASVIVIIAGPLISVLRVCHERKKAGAHAGARARCHGGYASSW